MVLSDAEIRRRMGLQFHDPQRLMIAPFAERTSAVNGAPSHGLQSFGYDLRLGYRFIRADDVFEAIFLTLGPHDFVLAESVEHVSMPLDCTAFVQTKSTWARRGLCLNMTPLEAGWRGVVTLELANLTPRPIRLEAGWGIGQVVFLQGTGTCQAPYSGAYQDQPGVTPALCGGR